MKLPTRKEIQLQIKNYKKNRVLYLGKKWKENGSFASSHAQKTKEEIFCIKFKFEFEFEGIDS